MIRNKKGIESFIVVLFVIIAVGAILVKGAMDKDVEVKIGQNQMMLLKTYTEGEKVRAYLNQAGKFALMQAARELGASGQNCFAVPGLDAKFKEDIKSYTSQDVSSSPNLKVILPFVVWSIKITNNKVTVIGVTGDKIQIAAGEDIVYYLDAYVNQTVTCDDVDKFSGATKSFLAG